MSVIGVAGVRPFDSSVGFVRLGFPVADDILTRAGSRADHQDAKSMSARSAKPIRAPAPGGRSFHEDGSTLHRTAPA